MAVQRYGKESEIDFLTRQIADSQKQVAGSSGLYPNSGYLNAQVDIQNSILRDTNRLSSLKQDQAMKEERQQFDTRLSDLVSRADPFASQRGQYQTQLADLMRDPTAAMQNNPFMKASAEQGMEAASRRLAQMGMSTSGNAALELQKAGQANMSQDYFKLADLLGGMAGAKADPSAGAQAGLGMLKLREDSRQFDLGKGRVDNYSARQKVGAPNLGSYWGQ